MKSNAKRRTSIKVHAVFAIFTAFLIATFSAEPAQAFMSRTNAECYGDELGLRLTNPANSDSADITLRLPHPEMWIVNMGGGEMLREVPCRPEPVMALQATSPITHGGMPQDVRDVLESAGLLLTTVRLSIIFEDGLQYYEQSRDYILEYLADAPTTPEGHLRKQSVAMDAVGGSWLLNEAYLDEVGERINVGCALDCKFRYRILPRLTFTYYIAVANKTRTPDWIEIDRVLRKEAMSWIVEG